jgi:hypothetical protein
MPPPKRRNRRSAQARAGRRKPQAAAVVNARAGRPITRGGGPHAPAAPTGRLRNRTARHKGLSRRQARAARTKTQLGAVAKLLPTMPPEQLGGADPAVLLERLRRTLERVEIEKYSDARLARTQGLARAWLGDVYEDIIACNKPLWRELTGYAGAELTALNKAIASGAAVRFDARGEVHAVGDLPPAERPPAF